MASPSNGPISTANLLRLLLTSAGFAGFVGLVSWSMSTAGVVNVTFAYVLLFAAWFLGVICIHASEALQNVSAIHRLAVTACFAALLGVLVYLIGVFEAHSRPQSAIDRTGEILAEIRARPALSTLPPPHPATSYGRSPNVGVVLKETPPPAALHVSPVPQPTTLGDLVGDDELNSPLPLYFVEVGSAPSETLAAEALREVRQRFPSVRAYALWSRRTNDQASQYQELFGAFLRPGDAGRICDSLTPAAQSCAVVGIHSTQSLMPVDP